MVRTFRDRDTGTTPRFWLNLQAQYDLDIRADHLGDRLDHEVTAHAT
jgi:antitoxin HigA-1